MIKIIPAPLAAGAGAGGGNPFSYINIIAGTITTDTSQLTTTVTRNASGVTFGASWKLTITDTASAAGSLAMQILGGASGTSNLFTIAKDGTLTTPPLLSHNFGGTTIYSDTNNFYMTLGSSIGQLRLHTGWTVTGDRHFIPGNGTVQATNMTTGFIQTVGAAGAPSGTPTNTTGFPIYWDSTNLQLYVYTGGAWKKSAAFT